MGRYDNERLTDNTKIKYCTQCRDCLFWGNDDAFSNRFDKTSCDMYPYPDFKPEGIINNTEKCVYYTKRGDGQ